MKTFHALWQDVRFATRLLRKTPGFAGITILTLALGVAGNIVIFSIFNSFYLRPFPFVEPGRLVDLDETAPRWNLEYTGIAYPDFHGWREHNRSFVDMAVWKNAQYNLSFDGRATRVSGARVTYDMASVLGIKPILGRSILPEEDRPGGAKVVLLGNGFWKREFGSDPEVIGRTLKLDDAGFTIIGVLPPDKDLLVEGEFWVPLAADPAANQGWSLRGVGRLKAGVTLAIARADLQRVHQGLVEKRIANENTSPRLTLLSDRFFGGARPIIQALLGAVVVVLLIACGNVAALMLARGLARSRELGIRRSLGAPLGRVAMLIGVESLLLAGIGGLAGTILGRWGLHTLVQSVPEQPPRWISFEMDWRVWVFIAFMVLVSALLGALPVIRSAAKADLRGALQSSAQQSTPAGGGRRTLRALVVAEMALTMVLTVQAGLLLQTFRALRVTDPGYRADHVLLYEVALPSSRYGSGEAKQRFFQNHLERVRKLPGVVSASAVSAPPLGSHWGNFFNIENAPPRARDEQDPVVLQRIAFPGYFETMGIRLLAGRTFAEQDGLSADTRAVIVNETFAKRFWPDKDAVGKRISHRYPNAPWMKVVGVTRDVKHYGVAEPMIPGVYLPFAQAPQGEMTCVIRSAVEPVSLVPNIRALVRESDPDLAVFAVARMQDRLSRSLWVQRLSASLFGIFSAVALVMALGGVYGVFSYVVNRRTQEIGVRLALGAQRREVLWLVVRQGLTLAGLGIGIGLVVALAVSPLLRSLLFGVSSADPLIIGLVILLLSIVALLACWLPARRAAKVDPMQALRCE